MQIRSGTEIIEHPSPGQRVVVAGFGEQAQWLRNGDAHPEVRLYLGSQTATASHSPTPATGSCRSLPDPLPQRTPACVGPATPRPGAHPRTPPRPRRLRPRRWSSSPPRHNHSEHHAAHHRVGSTLRHLSTRKMQPTFVACSTERPVARRRKAVGHMAIPPTTGPGSQSATIPVGACGRWATPAQHGAHCNVPVPAGQ